MSTHPKRSLQEWVHWFEVGDGSRRLGVAALAAAALLVSCFFGYKLFRGPLTEVTMAQAVTGRQVAEGAGFTTLVNYPQSFAWAQERAARGKPVDVTRPLPELHQPPLYAAAVAAAHWALPARRLGADNVLLALNVALLWCAAMQAFFLARAFFGGLGGVIALAGVLLSAPIWAATVAVNGAALTMVLWLALFQCVLRTEARPEENDGPARRVPGRRVFAWAAAAGGVCGLLFLSDYATFVALPLLCAVMWRRVRNGKAVVLAASAFVLVAGPWMMRNVALTGNPVAFAWQGLALKAGDPTAEPSVQRALFSTDAPAFDARKIANKALTSLQRGTGEWLWSGGGIFFTAFFVAGFAYRFRDARANRLRWLAAGLLACVALSQAFFDSGEGERAAWLCLAPLVIVFGAGFFLVLARSNAALETRVLPAALALLAAQAIPLARDVMEPRGARAYNYPPYLPALFSGIGQKLSEGRAEPVSWMADVPAGAAWYAGQRVWARPATMEGFRQVSRWQPVRALVLTPETLARPFFGELAKTPDAKGADDEWAAVYRGLAEGRLPQGFPLNVPVRIALDFYVLIDSGTARRGP